MDPRTSKKTTPARATVDSGRGNFYFGLGFALLAGLIFVIGLGVFGITGLGFFTASTAFAMTGIAITLIAGVSFVTLIALRRTINLLGQHDAALANQASRHRDLSAKVQSQWRAEQVVRDREQDVTIAAISTRQDQPVGRSTRNGARQASRGHVVPADPFEAGQVHPVIDVEGIGEHYGAALAAIGLKDTRQLWNADTTYVAGALQVTPAAVDGWQCMAELMAVTGIGKQYAELLVRADVSSIDGLGAETPQELLGRINRLEKHRGTRIQGNPISIKIVEGWIYAAQAHYGLVPSVKRGA